MIATITIDFGQNPPVYVINPNGASHFAILNAVSSMKDALLSIVSQEAITELQEAGIEVTNETLQEHLRSMVDSYNLTRKDDDG